MSIRADINKAFLWYRYETKTITITVLDAAGSPVNLTGITLSWRIFRTQGSAQVLLTKTSGGGGISISGAGNNVVTIAVSVSDYTLLTAGIHYHELWDAGNDNLLSHGDVFIHQTRGAPP